jgi:hypothetical protein
MGIKIQERQFLARCLVERAKHVSGERVIPAYRDWHLALRRYRKNLLVDVASPDVACVKYTLVAKRTAHRNSGDALAAAHKKFRVV